MGSRSYIYLVRDSLQMFRVLVFRDYFSKHVASQVPRRHLFAFQDPFFSKIHSRGSRLFVMAICYLGVDGGRVGSYNKSFAWISQEEFGKKRSVIHDIPL